MKHSPHPRISAFSLVEVVLAIGILAFAAITILGLFGQLYRSDEHVAEMRAAVGAANSLRDHLQNEAGFATVYDWARGGDKELVYASFLADEDGNPDPGGAVRDEWFALPVADEAAIEATRQGRWLKGVLRPHPTANPVAPASLPAIDSYPHSYLVMEIDIHVAADPDLAPTGRPVLNTAIAVHRK